ncbi:MAG: hypothetical protein IJS00_06070, partial [Paludibacteraceae bacterium]|nr:hypothetical protein [Paludibacteraceae bacterium]
MKKVVTILCLFVLGISSTVLADPYPIYQNISYCKLRYCDSQGTSTQFNISLFDSSNNSKLFVHAVNIGSKSRIEGMHRVALYSTSKYDYTTYFYDKDNDEYANPSGYVEFHFSGNFSGSDPIYRVHFYLQGYYNGTAYVCDFDKEIPVRMTNYSDSRWEINNEIIEVNIPGCNSHVSADAEGYFNYIGQSESRLFRMESMSVDGDEGRFLGWGRQIDNNYTWSQKLPSGSQDAPGDASCDVDKYNGFYFFDGYFNYNNACFHVTMQYPNYQAENNTYTQTFDWENVSLTRRADFATSGVVTLTATNAGNKKVVLDFVVDIEAVGTTGDIVIPAGDYTVSTTEEEGTVIASGGINYDLTVKNSYAGTTTALTSSNYSTNPLWCFRTGTISVEEGMANIIVSANQDYRNAPVNITINGPVTPIVNHTITIIPPTNGTITVLDEDENEISSGDEVSEDTPLTITATPNTFYEFVRWSDDNTDNPRTVTMNSDVTLTAQFAVATNIELNDN